MLQHALRQGYYGNDAATAAAFRAGVGWFDTGDLGWVAPRDIAGSHMAGTVVLSGRSKDTIVLSRCGGRAMYPCAKIVCAHLSTVSMSSWLAAVAIVPTLRCAAAFCTKQMQFHSRLMDLMDESDNQPVCHEVLTNVGIECYLQRGEH